MSGRDSDIDDLARQVEMVAVGSTEFTHVEKQIRNSVRSAIRRKDIRKNVALRLLHGKLLLVVDKPVRAMRQFRIAACQDPDAAGAWIGMANTSILRGHLSEAQQYLMIACTKAKQSNNDTQHLAALDSLAFLATEREDEESCRELLHEMYSVVHIAQKLDAIALVTVESLLEKDMGALAIPYLECLAGDFVLPKKEFGWMNVIASLLVRGYQQSGLSDEDISKLLLRFKPWASKAKVDQILRRGDIAD